MEGNMQDFKATKEETNIVDFKNKTFFDSIKCAFNGLAYAIKTEKNYKYYFGIATFFLIINIICKIPFGGFLAYFITTFGVLAAECINTSIEHFVNLFDMTIKEEIKIIKDIAASTVLCWGFAFFICEAVSIGSVFIW
jgi:diacylglycerol kinase